MSPPPPVRVTALALSILLTVALFACTGEERPTPQRRAGANRDGTSSEPARRTQGYGAPVLLGRIKDDSLTESSGLAASRLVDGVYWTHNDSGGGPVLHCVDDRARSCGLWRVPGADAIDWEDMAAAEDASGKPFLYIGDIGDNGSRRASVTVYRVPEPRVTPGGGGRGAPRTTAPATALEFVYPDGPHNAETLMVRAGSGELYIVTKEYTRPAGVYKAAPPFGRSAPIELERVASLRVLGRGGAPFTGGDIAPDGDAVALVFGPIGFELRRQDGHRPFDSIWDEPLSPVGVGGSLRGEAIAYSREGEALLATSEGRRSPLFKIPGT